MGKNIFLIWFFFNWMMGLIRFSFRSFPDECFFPIFRWLSYAFLSCFVVFPDRHVFPWVFHHVRQFVLVMLENSLKNNFPDPVKNNLLEIPKKIKETLRKTKDPPEFFLVFSKLLLHSAIFSYAFLTSGGPGPPEPPQKKFSPRKFHKNSSHFSVSKICDLCTPPMI